MFDLTPFMDEVHIVEIGRLALCGGDPYTILMAPDGSPAMSIYYVGPCIQEFAFRLLGAAGPRITSLLGAFLSAFFFWTWLRKTSTLARGLRFALTLIALTVPMMFQCVIMGRADNLSIASAFAILAILGSPREERSAFRLVTAGFLATLSVFIWPSSTMFAPLYPVFCFNLQRKREFAVFCLSAILSLPLLLIPIYPILASVLQTLTNHLESAAPPLSSFAMGVIMVFLRETARAPFLMTFAFLGLAIWVRNRRFMAIFAFTIALTLGCATGFYSFRFVYLTPFFLLMLADAASELEKSTPKVSHILLGLTCAYGILTGPIGHLLTPHETLPANLKEELAAYIGEGPVKVFSPDYATYYIGRELGWRQFAHANPGMYGDPNKLKSCLAKADIIVQYEWDPYQPIQQTCTPFGYASKFLLNAARKEKNAPNKSWFAKCGAEAAHPWRAPCDFPGFHKVKTIGRIEVYRKD